MKIVYGLDEIELVAQKLKQEVAGCDVITFSGSLGAGKTTLIRALCKALGIQDEVTSPTFAYLNLYKDAEGKRFVHFDLYRLQHLDEFIAAGFDEYLIDNTVFIEWPEVIVPLLKSIPTCHISIDYDGIDKRILTLKKELP